MIIKDFNFCDFSAYDRPRLIEALQGKGVVEIACGGAHSAAITAAGELYTWGKGRYGRLGHNDSEVCNSDFQMQTTKHLFNIFIGFN